MKLYLFCWYLDETNDFWKRYRHIEVRYTKCGLDENEIARHNKTPLCGMDNTLPNSYANCLLQVTMVHISICAKN